MLGGETGKSSIKSELTFQIRRGNLSHYRDGTLRKQRKIICKRRKQWKRKKKELNGEKNGLHQYLYAFT
jgi:hypothetical protein